MSWQSVKLGECLKLINGRAYSQHELLESGTPVIRIQNLNGGDRWYYSNIELPEDKYCVKGDLLFAWSASFGPYIWWGEKSIFHYHIWRVIPFENLDKAYAYYLLDSITQNVRAASHGASMLHMTKTGMENWEIKLPTLPEQKRIAAILDKADELKRKREAAIAKLDQLAQSIFVEMFGDLEKNTKQWESCCLSDEVFVQGGYAFKSNSFLDQGIRLVKISNVHKDNLIWDDDVDYLPNAFLEKYKSFVLEQGDIVLALTRPIIKSLSSVKIATISAEDLPCLLNQRVARFLFKENSKLLPDFLLGYCQSEVFYKIVSRLCSVSLQPNISTNQISKINIPIPPLELQHQYTNKLDAIRKIKEICMMQRIQSEKLFTSLQHQAFAGQL